MRLEFMEQCIITQKGEMPLELMTILGYNLFDNCHLIKKCVPTAFWAAAACNAPAFTWIGFPSGLITVTVFPKN